MTVNFVKIVGALFLTASTSLYAAAANDEALAIFAGGCFWCVESDFDHVPGVTKTISGYTGGTLKPPPIETLSGAARAIAKQHRLFMIPVK